MENIAPGVATTPNKHLPAVPPPTPAPQPNPPTTPTYLQPLTKLPYTLHPRTSCPHYAAPITHRETGKSMEYRDLINDPSTRATWLRSTANEFGRLAQGLSDNRVEPTNTILTNDLPTPILSAATVPKKLNLTAHTSPSAATSSITLAI